MERTSRGRWLQVSLRTCMFAVLLLSLMLAWVASERAKLHAQSDAIERVKSLGGSMWTASPSSRTWRQWLFGHDPSIDATDLCVGGDADDACLRLLPQMPQLRVLDIVQCRITDANLSYVRAAHGLTIVRLAGVFGITDAGVARLCEMQQLELFGVTDNVTITDAAFANLDQLTRLRGLFVRRNGKRDITRCPDR